MVSIFAFMATCWDVLFLFINALAVKYTYLYNIKTFYSVKYFQMVTGYSMVTLVLRKGCSEGIGTTTSGADVQKRHMRL